MTVHEEDTIRDAEDQLRAPIPRRTGTVHSNAYLGGDTENQPSLVTEESNGQQKRIKLASHKELKEEAGCK